MVQAALQCSDGASDNTAWTTAPRLAVHVPRAGAAQAARISGMHTNDAPRRLILASSSRYRQELLARLRMPFESIAPNVDEAALPGETAAALAVRLALAKAQAVAQAVVHSHPGAVVIGSDQVCELDGIALGKPGNHARATQQLATLSGREALFHTAVAVVHRDGGFVAQDLATVRVRFRTLHANEIERYLRLDEPYDCAGSARCETLGIALLQRIDNDDPTALIGLPLIRTLAMLRAAGIDPLRP